MFSRALSRFALALVLATPALAEGLSYEAAGVAPHGFEDVALGVPAFDTRLGTLVRVEIDIVTEFDTHVQVENTGALLGIAQTSLHSRANLRVPGQSAPFVRSDARGAKCALPASDGTPDFAGPSSTEQDARFALDAHVVVTSNLEKFVTRGAPKTVVLHATARSVAAITCNQPTISRTEFGSAHRVRVTYVFDRSP